MGRVSRPAFLKRKRETNDLKTKLDRFGRQRPDTGRNPPGSSQPTPIDFRYSPLQHQTAFCFPDDPHKSLVRQDGALLYGHQRGHDLRFFPIVISFSLQGMETGRIISPRLK